MVDFEDIYIYILIIIIDILFFTKIINSFHYSNSRIKKLAPSFNLLVVSKQQLSLLTKLLPLSFFNFPFTYINVPNSPSSIGTHKTIFSSSNVMISYARNLPEDNGASGKNRGSVESLSSIVNIRKIITEAIQSSSDVIQCGRLF